MNFLSTMADYLRAFLTFVKTQEENRQEIEELRAEVENLTTTLKLVVLQSQHDRENERHEREKFMLQVENELLRRLPPKGEN